MSATSTTIQKPSASTTMKAIARDTYGSADGLELREMDRPEIAPDEVLVRVRAAGLDRGVWHVMRGIPYPIRIAGYGLRAPKVPVPGHDVAGVVEVVGSEVTSFKSGDEIFGSGKGSFAEYTAVPEKKLAPKPSNLTFEEASAVPTSASTALQAVRDKGHIQAGQSVLIIGASGGVGSFAVQIAKAFGAEVTGVCSTSKVDLVRSLGADHVIDYKTTDFAQGDKRYDVILDVGGNSSLTRLRHALTSKGTLVMVGGETDGKWFGGMGRQVRAMVTFPFVNQKLGTFVAKVNSKDLLVLKQLVEAGKVTPALQRTYSLSEAPQAIRDLEAGRVKGKVAIIL
jgi:NADPH:quinone reductase-like Zn-dependent oxidoreductase